MMEPWFSQRLEWIPPLWMKRWSFSCRAIGKADLPQQKMQVEGQCNLSSLGNPACTSENLGPFQSIACPQLIMLVRPASHCQLSSQLSFSPSIFPRLFKEWYEQRFSFRAQPGPPWNCAKAWVLFTFRTCSHMCQLTAVQVNTRGWAHT